MAQMGRNTSTNLCRSNRVITAVLELKESNRSTLHAK